MLFFTLLATIALGVQAQAQAPCPELMRLRNTASLAWRQAMRVPRSERCGALYEASSATKETLDYAANNAAACGISAQLLSEVENYHREAVQARKNVCAGRPLRPYPADVIQR